MPPALCRGRGTGDGPPRSCAGVPEPAPQAADADRQRSARRAPRRRKASEGQRGRGVDRRSEGGARAAERSEGRAQPPERGPYLIQGRYFVSDADTDE